MPKGNSGKDGKNSPTPEPEKPMTFAERIKARAAKELAKREADRAEGKGIPPRKYADDDITPSSINFNALTSKTMPDVQAFNLEDTKKLISRVEKLGDVESAAQALKIVQHNSIRWSRKYDKARAGYDKYVFNPKPNQEEPKKAARQHMDAAKNVQDAFEYQYQRAHRALRDAQRRAIS